LNALNWPPEKLTHLQRLWGFKPSSEADDVLLNIVGASIGRCAKATTAISGGNLNQAVAIIRLIEPMMPDFVVNYLLSANA
jgi:hypothetical protein